MNKGFILLAAVLMIFSCSKEQEKKTLKIITTTSFVSDTVSRIAGDSLEIKKLIKTGQDPHTYEPSPRDIAAVETADLIFVSGFELEEGLLKILAAVNKDKIVELSSSVNPITHDDDEDDHDDEGEHSHEIDPHTWLSPLNVIKWTEVISDSLSTISPGNSSDFEENRKEYTQELLDLHNSISAKVSSIPEEKRILFTDHDSFAYFAREYGFNIEGTIIPGTSSSSETSASALIALINRLRETRISAIFVGDTSGPDMKKLAENITEELDYPVKIISLKTGSIGVNGSETDNYIKYMSYNTDKIASALKGEL